MVFVLYTKVPQATDHYSDRLAKINKTLTAKLLEQTVNDLTKMIELLKSVNDIDLELLLFDQNNKLKLLQI